MSAAWTALLLAAGALAAAFGSEWFLGLTPCEICLIERWPYRVALALAALALAVPGRSRALLALALLGFLAALGLSALHVGVEHHLWPSPFPGCRAPDLAGLSLAERLHSLPSRPATPCDDPVYPTPLPVSFATLSFLYALAASAILAISLRRGERA